VRKLKFYFLLPGMMFFAACSKQKEDEVSSVNKEAAIETELSVEHLDKVDLLVTRHRIWRDNKLLKEIIKKDTIPALRSGFQAVPDSSSAAGYRIKEMKDDYEFYITVQ